MGTRFKQEGKVLTHSPAAAVAVDDVVVMQDSVGVALVDIAASGEGSVAVAGAFSVPKVAGSAWTQGQLLDWDVAGVHFQPTAAPGVGITFIRKVAYAAKDALSADTEGEVVLMNPGESITG